MSNMTRTRVMEVPTVAEYLAAGASEADALGLHEAVQRVADTARALEARGFQVHFDGPGSAKGEAALYAKGYRPYLLDKQADMQLNVLGLWAKKGR